MLMEVAGILISGIRAMARFHQGGSSEMAIGADNEFAGIGLRRSILLKVDL